jgi:gliding-associated putative ABC transporter substrate-binding component GldG
MKKRQSLTTSVLLISAIIVVVNIISFSFFFRLDFTRDKRFTLNTATLDLLKNLKQPVTITAYFSENMPPQIEEGRKEFKDLLAEYAARSGNKVVYNFINPNKNDTAEKEAEKNGIKPANINDREKDEMKVQRAYMGAVVKYGDKTDVIPFIQPGGANEYELSKCIKKLSIDKKPFVGLLQGNGEATMQNMQQVYSELNILYNYQNVNLTDTTVIPAECKTLIIIDPKDTFRTAQLKQLDNYLAKGGHIFMAYSGLEGDMQNGSGKVLNIGLTQWLASKDIVLEPKFVIDGNCGRINVPKDYGNGMKGYEPTPFPYAPTITNFSNHPITQGLSKMLMPFVSAIKFTGDTNKVKYTELVHTSDKTGLLNAPLTFQLQTNWTLSEFPLSNLPIAAAISGVGGNKNAKIVIVSCGSFVFNGTGEHAVEQAQDNIDLLANSVDWLSDDTGLIELRSKMIKTAPLKDISDSTKQILRYLNFLLPILLVIIYGAIRMQMKRRTRVKRMEETYAQEA